MLSDNIRKYRKSKQMSQDELAEKLKVTRQSISLWETGQTQPSLDNIVALAKLFDVSTDALLTDNEPKADEPEQRILKSEDTGKKKKGVLIVIAGAVIVSALVAGVLLWKSNNLVSDKNVIDSDSSNVAEPAISSETKLLDENDESQTEKTNVKDEKSQSSEVDEKKDLPVKENEIIPEVKEEGISEDAAKTEDAPKTEDIAQSELVNKNENTYPDDKTEKPVVETKETAATENEVEVAVPEKTENVSEVQKTEAEKDIFGYLKNFVIQNGTVNGDYCYYSKSADNYGGYSSENFTLYYWGDTDTVEFCLHSVLDDTFSINFYIRVPQKYSDDYQYISSYYYRDTGEPLYEARGIIKAAEFTKNYPLYCDEYYGSTEAQNNFMEMSRQGISDLIDCLENFITVENLEYSFEDFGFTKF